MWREALPQMCDALSRAASNAPQPNAPPSHPTPPSFARRSNKLVHVNSKFNLRKIKEALPLPNTKDSPGTAVEAAVADLQ